ncbi:MAG TPA: hypothetical protein VGY99_00455 [Candidatus Binataceae bacterium]|nr:hypothetical protein [Candidatus Binataceae bacterium]
MAQVVDLARKTSTQERDLIHRFERKQLPARALCAEKTIDIVAYLPAPQRAQQRAGSDSLIKRAEFRIGEALGEFRLTDQDDLERVTLRRPGVGQQAQFFQGFVTQSLSLVEDQDHSIGALRIGHECFERLERGELALPNGMDSELLDDDVQHFFKAHRGVA